MPAVAAGGADPYAAARRQMVETEIVAVGIEDPRVVQAMRDTPRHEFVSEAQRPYAYYDMAIPIGYGQTISPPYVVAFMTQHVLPRPTDKVLEIGTGSGYQAAVLSGLVDQVYSIEIVEPLGRRAARTLQRLGYKNVHTRIGDGYQGWPEHAPFDKIIVTCSPENIPQPLIDQLAEGGRIVVPLGERFQQVLYLFTKVGGQLRRQPLEATFFVPMTGLAEKQREVKPGAGTPQLVHGSFEEVIDDSAAPAGWFYARQAQVVADAAAPVGSKCLAFANQTAGRGAHALQAFGVDGRQTRRLRLALWGPRPRSPLGTDSSSTGQGRSSSSTTSRGPPWDGLDWARGPTALTGSARPR